MHFKRKFVWGKIYKYIPLVWVNIDCESKMGKNNYKLGKVNIKIRHSRK